MLVERTVVMAVVVAFMVVTLVAFLAVLVVVTLVAFLAVLVVMTLVTLFAVFVVVTLVAFFAVLVVMAVVVRFVTQSLRTREAGDRNCVNHLGLGVRSLQQRGHESVVTTAVLHNYVCFGQLKLVFSSRLIGVRVFRRVVNNRRDIYSVTANRLSNVGVDVGRCHHVELVIAGITRLGSARGQNEGTCCNDRN